jgi:hypothetical protein
MTAAGMSRPSHFDPPYRAAIPRKIRTPVQPIDFLEFALMAKIPFQGFNVSKLQVYEPEILRFTLNLETLKL